MKKYVLALLAGFAFLVPLSVSLAQTATTDAIKAFTVTLAEPASGTAAKVGSAFSVKWTYSPRPNFNQVDRIGISLIDGNGVAYSAGAPFSGAVYIPGSAGGNLETLVLSHKIIVPNLPAGDYRIKIDVAPNAKGGSAEPMDTTTGTIAVVAAGTPSSPDKPGPKLVAHIMFAPPVRPHPGDTVSLKITTNALNPYVYAYLLSGGQQVTEIDEGPIVGDIQWKIPSGLDTNLSYNFSLKVLNPADHSNFLVNYTSPGFRLFAASSTGSGGGNGPVKPVTISSCTPSVGKGADIALSTAGGITFTATIDPMAIDAAKTYTYSWNGTNGVKGTTLVSDPMTYRTPGTKTARIMVKVGTRIVGSLQCDSFKVHRNSTNGAEVFEAAQSFWDSLWH